SRAAPTESPPRSLHDALPISLRRPAAGARGEHAEDSGSAHRAGPHPVRADRARARARLSVQPRFLTISGPSRLAMGSGSRFQAAMKARYFGLSGLTSGADAPGFSRNSCTMGSGSKPQFFLNA